MGHICSEKWPMGHIWDTFVLKFMSEKRQKSEKVRFGTHLGHIWDTFENKSGP